MSIAALTAVFRRSYGNPTRKLIMASLADYADEKGRAWPSIDTLASRAECSRRSVQEHLARLEQEGHIRIEHNAGPSGTHFYHLAFSKKSDASTPSAKGGADSARGVQNSAGDLHGGGANQRRQSAPEPSGTVRNRQEGEKPPAPASDLVGHLHRVFFLAPRAFSKAENEAMETNAALLAEMGEDDWTALLAWNSASDRLRGRQLWPRDRVEFLQRVSEALQLIRPWWRSRGREWWENRKPARQPAKPAPSTTAPRVIVRREELAEVFGPRGDSS